MSRPVKPMLATLVDKPFDGKDWLFEIKWDGYRAIAETGKNSKLYSRAGQDFSAKYPKIIQSLKLIKQRCVIDGEIVVINDRGFSDFQALQNYGSHPNNNLRYYVFDLLYLGRKNLERTPLWERKKSLKSVIPKKSLLKYSDHVLEKGISFFRQAEKAGLEGIVAKNTDSFYKEGFRGEDWLKIKTHKRQEAVIVGFTSPKGSRQFFGSLLLGLFEKGKLKYAGHAGTGFNYESLKYLHRKLVLLKQEESAIRPPPAHVRSVTWVKPRLVCEVSFTQWTNDGQMRHPVFEGLREDKPAAQVRAEIEKTIK